jgi:hypothetical protein
MTAFIDDHRDVYGVEPICAVLPIAPSTDYKQKTRQADPSRLPKRARRDAALRMEIERVCFRLLCTPAMFPGLDMTISK